MFPMPPVVAQHLTCGDECQKQADAAKASGYTTEAERLEALANHHYDTANLYAAALATAFFL